MRLVEDLVKSHVEILNTIDGLSDEELNRSAQSENGRPVIQSCILRCGRRSSQGLAICAQAMMLTGHMRRII